jgi:hypothetical protein
MFHLESQESKRILDFASGNGRPLQGMQRLNQPLFGMAFTYIRSYLVFLIKYGDPQTKDIENEGNCK